MIATRSGGEARLQVSTEVPYLDWFMEYGWRYTRSQARVHWQSVGSFLVVKPTIVGTGKNEKIKIEIIPELSGSVDGQSHAIRYAGLSTQLIAAPGQTIRIGGHAQHADAIRKFLFGIDRHGKHEILDIELTPSIMELK